jgi:hypothetical protein
MEQLVKIKNIGEVDFRQVFDTHEVVEIPSGEEIIVPWTYMVAFMGDPGLRNYDRWREREEAHETFLIKYAGNLPLLEASTLDGTKIVTILDDPVGDSLTPEVTDTTDVGLLQRQIDALQARISSFEPTETTIVEDLPTDEPTKVPVSRRKR